MRGKLIFLQLAIVAGLTLAAYAPAFGRYFVSEDFFVLRWLAERSLWESTWAHLTGPLLEITFVKFYRPVAGLLAHLEVLAWGTTPAGYLVTHLALHSLNVALVYRLVRAWSGDSRAEVAGVATVFALYPLHVNAVLFVAAFATLTSAAFLLASLLLYESFREHRDPRRLLASLAFFALALGSYEQTVVLPVLIVARELLATWESRQRSWRKLWASGRPGAAYFALLAVYFLVRRAALGETVAGYEGFQARLLAGEVARLGREILIGLARLVYPSYEQGVAELAVAGIGVVLVALTILALIRRGLPSRLWLLGGLWILATQAPFVFAGVVPGNGRYWYLTSIGLGLAITAVASQAARIVTRWRRGWDSQVVVGLVTTAVGLGYFALLSGYASTYRDAGALARTIQGRLAQLPVEPGQRVFVTGHPDFLRGSRQTPIAQVFYWGLSDAVGPPFVDAGPTVFPLPPLDDAELLPLLERPDAGTVWRWLPEPASFVQVRLGERMDPPRLLTAGDDAGRLRFRATGDPHRLVVVARGSTSSYPVHETPDAGGWTRVRWPDDVVRSWHHVYDGEIYGWIEARRNGRLTAVSRLLSVQP